MHIQGPTLDDVLNKVYKRLLSHGQSTRPSRGSARELSGVLIELKNPLARLSRTETRGRLFSSLGEFLWYFTGDNELSFIEWYIKGYQKEHEYGRIYGGYGPRLFRKNGFIDQFKNITYQIFTNPDTRRAVIQIFDAEDIQTYHKEIPCTCTMQFLLRKGQLNLFVNMRSNDAFIGLPHDVFCFTMIQEVVAKTLNAKVGTYKHFVGSLHLYDANLEGAEEYISEHYQPHLQMPEMPTEDPLSKIRSVLSLESQIRQKKDVDNDLATLPVYWQDIARLIQLYAISNEDSDKFSEVRSRLSTDIFDPYILTRAQKNPPEVPKKDLEQLILNLRR